MPLPKMPIRRDARPGDRDYGSEIDRNTGWWEPTPTKQPTDDEK